MIPHWEWLKSNIMKHPKLLFMNPNNLNTILKANKGRNLNKKGLQVTEMEKLNAQIIWGSY